MSAGIESLSAKELTALRGVAALKSAKQIALELGVSSKTVETHLARARAKLGASTSGEAARLLIAHEGRMSGDFPREASRLSDSLAPVQFDAAVDVPSPKGAPTSIREWLIERLDWKVKAFAAVLIGIAAIGSIRLLAEALVMLHDGLQAIVGHSL